MLSVHCADRLAKHAVLVEEHAKAEDEVTEAKDLIESFRQQIERLSIKLTNSESEQVHTMQRYEGRVEMLIFEKERISARVDHLQAELEVRPSRSALTHAETLIVFSHESSCGGT